MDRETLFKNLYEATKRYIDCPDDHTYSVYTDALREIVSHGLYDDYIAWKKNL